MPTSAIEFLPGLLRCSKPSLAATKSYCRSQTAASGVESIVNRRRVPASASNSDNVGRAAPEIRLCEPGDNASIKDAPADSKRR